MQIKRHTTAPGYNKTSTVETHYAQKSAVYGEGNMPTLTLGADPDATTEYYEGCVPY